MSQQSSLTQSAHCVRQVLTAYRRGLEKLAEDGRRRLVRHGHLLEREIITGIVGRSPDWHKMRRRQQI